MIRNVSWLVLCGLAAGACPGSQPSRLGDQTEPPAGSTPAPPLTIAPIDLGASGGRYALTAGGGAVTRTFTLKLKNDSPTLPVAVKRVMALRTVGGAKLWDAAGAETISPGETKTIAVELPPVAQSSAGILTVDYQSGGSTFHTDTAALVVTQKIGSLADVVDAAGKLKPGCYEGNLAITAPVTLQADKLGDFVLYGTVSVTGAKDVSLVNLVIHKDTAGTVPALKLSNATHCRVAGSRVWSSLPQEKSSSPSALLADTCHDLQVDGTTLLGNGVVAQVNYGDSVALTNSTVYPDVFVGAQYGWASKQNDVGAYIGLLARGCHGLTLTGDYLQAPGRDGLALNVSYKTDWRASHNFYWGVMSASNLAPDLTARNIADWREATGQDSDSTTLGLDMVRNPVLGAEPDPRGALTGPPNITIAAPPPPARPDTTLSVGVFDGEGRLVRTLLGEYEWWRSRGPLKLHWDGTDNFRHAVSSGNYVARAYRVQLGLRQGSLGNSRQTQEQRFQHELAALFVTPDGRAYTDSGWDEAGRESAEYGPDGAVVATMPQTHGWGSTGGTAVAVSDKYVFTAVGLGHIEDPHDFPPKGETWYGVQRYTLDAKFAPWPTGKGGWWHDMLIVGTKPCVAGLAYVGGKLYLSDTITNRVRVFDQETMAEERSFAFDRPGPLAADAAGNLWILRQAGPAAPRAIVRVASNGRPNGAVTGVVADPGALAIDPKGRLLVADNGSSQVLVFDVTGATAKQVGVVGERGGVWAGPTPGATGALRFHDIVAVGADAAGSVWVGMYGGATQLVKIGPDGKQAWSLDGLTFLDTAAADPASPEDVYTKYAHFRVDYATDPPAWRYVGYIRPKGGDDPREHLKYSSVQTARIGGKLFLFLSPMSALDLAIFRVEGEQAIPVGIVHGYTQLWPPNQPATRWVWRDVDGDGKIGPTEFVSDGKKEEWSYDWAVDSKGDIWHATYAAGIHHLPCQGLDARGYPVYDWAKDDLVPMPAPFKLIRAVRYRPEDGSLYVYGSTAEFLRDPSQGNAFGPPGEVLARYDNQRRLRWANVVGTSSNGMGLATAGGLVLTTDLLQASVQVFDDATGLELGNIGPGKQAGFASGWVDFPMSLQATVNKQGEVVAFNENDWITKVAMYALKPSVEQVGADVPVNR